MANDRENKTAEETASEETRQDELVEVFDTQQESEAMVVRSLLDSAGIVALISSLSAPQDVLPGVGGVIVRVRADQAEDARRIISEYRQSGDTGTEPEPPLNEDSAA
jgi:hypothetical protein